MDRHQLDRHQLDRNHLGVTGERRVVTRICVLAGVVTLVAAAAAFFIPDFTDTAMPSSWLVIPFVAAGFAVAEATVFHFEFRREAISFSLSEVPTAYALLFLAPGPAMGARVVGGLLAIVITRRSKWYKLLFNASLFAAETVLSFHIMRLAAHWFPGSKVALVLAVVPAAALATVAGSVLVSMAIAVVEGDLRRRLLPELRISAWLAPTNAVVAASMAAPTVVYPWLGLLSALPLMGFWGVMQGYGQLSQRYRDLSDLHGFVGRVGRSLDLDEIVHGAATEVAALLRAARAGIVVFDQRGDARRAAIG